MQRVLTAAELRELDRIASERHGVPIVRLMEAAGRAVADESAAGLAAGRRVLVFAGPGHNGGDGVVAARLLVERGVPVEVWLAAPPEGFKGEARANLGRLRALGVPLGEGVPPKAEAGCVAVDALLGTGLSRPASGRFAEGIAAIERARAAGARVVAVDVPSGLDADSGRPLGPCVQADVTVTMAVLKPGLCQEPGASLAGRIVTADIGVPREALAEIPSRLELLDEAAVRGLFHPRPRDSNKGSFGHLLIVAGGPGKAGAAALAVRGGLRSGSGLVTLASRPEVALALWTVAPEAMALALPGEGPLGPGDLEALRRALEGKSALALGPGIPRGPATGALVGELLAAFEGPTLLDADALNAIAGELGILARAKGPVVVTPHPGEMARLSGLSVAEVQADRLGVARRFAAEHRVTVVLKGARTVIADPDGAAAFVPTGNPGLAHGGTGDVLCGLVGGLLAQRLGPGDAARAGAYLHGLAGDLVARRRGERGLLASEVADALAELWAEWRL